MARSKNYRLHQKDKKVAKKKYILQHIYFHQAEELTPRIVGRLNKGKVHCSCPLCSTKTATHGLKDKQGNKWSEMEKEIRKHR